MKVVENTAPQIEKNYMSKLLTFELDKQNEVLEIHGNIEGLTAFRDKLDALTKTKSDEHIHMMIPSWGGEELSEDKQCEDNILIPHVKIFKWST